jgi:hypothetical protein
MKKNLALSAACAALVAAAFPALAENFRCGSRIASPEMTVEELLEACGNPTTRTTEVVEVTGPNVRGTGTVIRGTVVIETWTYDRGSQAAAMVVTIEDGKIKKMERAGS